YLYEITKLNNLLELNLSNIHLISDIGISSFIINHKYLKLLNHLNLSQCYQLSDQSFIYLQTCQNLQILNISYLNKITDDIIKILPLSLTQLIAINCHLLTKKCLEYLSLNQIKS